MMKINPYALLRKNFHIIQLRGANEALLEYFTALTQDLESIYRERWRELIGGRSIESIKLAGGMEFLEGVMKILEAHKRAIEKELKQKARKER